MNEELPREKLLRLGPKYLNMNELLSIILNNGTKNESVFDLSYRIIKDYGNDISIFKCVEQIVEQLKIPTVKASQICACVEIGRRIFDKNDDIFINSPKKVFENFKHLSSLKKTEFYIVILNNNNKIINRSLIYIGDDIKTLKTSEIFKILFELGFNKFILVCGSNYADTNREYIDFAIKLKKESVSLGVIFFDLIIIKDNSFISFIDKNII